MIHCSCILFQFTHPRGGATIIRSTRSSFQFTHLHGGCDIDIRIFCSFWQGFNSRTHVGVRFTSFTKRLLAMFQLTHPRGVRRFDPEHTHVGCDEKVLWDLRCFAIVSTHTPMWECDWYTMDCLRDVSTHAPTCGVRQHMMLKKLNVSTHAPTWGGECDKRHDKFRWINMVSTHAPTWGCD